MTFFDLHQDAAEVEREFINKRINNLSGGSGVDNVPAAELPGVAVPLGTVLEELDTADDCQDICSTGSAERSVGDGQ